MKKTMLSTTQSYVVCFLGILATFGIVMALCESGLADSYIKGIMMTACIAIIMTTSLNLTIGVLGQLTLGCCGFEAIGAYVAALASKYMVAAGIGVDPTARFLITTLIGGIVACVFGILIGIPALRLHGDYLAIITLGFGEIIRVIIQNLKVAGGMGLDKGAAGQALIGIERTANLYVVFWIMVVTVVVLFMFGRSRYGRAVKAIRDDEIAAGASGLNTTYLKVLVFAISAFFAGIAGGIFAQYIGSLNPTMAGWLNITFGGLKAVSDFNMTINKGELVGLIGPNGAGKTTVFNLLTGVYKPTEGDFWLDGEHMNGKKTYQVVRAGIARTFQNIRLFKQLTVEENVLVAFDESFSYHMGGAIFRTPGFWKQEHEMHEKAIDLLRIFNLEGLAATQAANLPYGQQRKLEIARALATGMKLLLLDEPAAGMNPTETEDLLHCINTIRDRFGIAILLIEHDMSLVMSVCQRIQVLDYGRTIASGTPEQIANNPQVISAYLGSDSNDDADGDSTAKVEPEPSVAKTIQEEGAR